MADNRPGFNVDSNGNVVLSSGNVYVPKTGNISGTKPTDADYSEANSYRSQYAQDFAKPQEGGVIGEITRAADRGKDTAKEYLPDGSLGRLQEGRSSEMANLIAEKRKAYDASPAGGLSSEELQGYRDQAVSNINKTSETARRRLAGVQAQTGVRGATAATQQMSAVNAGNSERTNFERDLFLRQRDALQQDRTEQAYRLSALETSVSSARANEDATQKFNLEQAAREKFGQLSTALSFASLASTDKASQNAIGAQIEAARVSAPSSGGGLLSKLF